ncbi:hypothetical protein [Bradyrhizobium murdochi]|uniref:hypothetical protein n=1 Tax=Bradyrhizobium murdochi TaxID=1038859 RepID=UPI0004135410|nr:hypothetical protein [Bradyrhizobium murdochi]
MAALNPTTRRKRTAILVVHGIGSQRALETMRGVIRGIWLDCNNPADKNKRVWTHPQKDGADIDLSVMTTNGVPDSKDNRSVDFHELYWAHLMSETRAVAVLLWLYELGRKGPIMKLGMNGLWWAAAIFLCLMNLSFAVLVLRGVLLFSGNSAQIMLVAPFLLLVASIFVGFAVACRWLAFRLIILFAVLLAGGGLLALGYFEVAWHFAGSPGIPDGAELVTLIALPTLIAFIATGLVMGLQGLRAFCWALFISLFLFGWFVTADRYWNSETAFISTVIKGWVWGLNSPWAVATAAAVIGLYLIVNAAFLQPYLGDAARYFRNSPANVAVRRAIRKDAVDTLERLHTSGQYDRIVVVAHSLGTVVAYDMLRAYFSRICSELPPVDQLWQEFADIDGAPWQPDDKTDAATHQDKADASAKVADAGLKKDFKRRVEEREFPTCPPKRLDADGLLTFRDPNTGNRRVHNGALFGLTRWTNIYFPRFQLFWGDAIGGALSPIFGYHIVDLEVATKAAGGADFFTHTAYWDVERKPDTYSAPHIVALRKAVDLVDKNDAIDLVDDGDDPTKHEGE